MLPEKIAFVDLETTGARNMYDRILEIGILRVENNVITRTFSSLLNPEVRIPPEIERLTGISPTHIENAPVFSSVKDEVLDILKDCTFVAHNVRFDYGFLRNEFKRVGIEYASKHFCTVKLSQYLYPEHRRHNLDSVIERLGIPCVSRHRALDDARVLTEFYQIIQKQFAPEILLEAVNKAQKKPSVPLHLDKSDLDSLPELPGVYIFYGDNDIPLYIGKSKNLKDRILSHFCSDIHNGVEMKISQQIKRIETRITAGELGALLLESQMIKEMLPLYNRQLRLKQQLVGLVSTQNQDGYDTLRLETVTSVSPGDLSIFSANSGTNPTRRLLAFFRSVRQAKEYLSTIAKDYNLCEKMLGLEKTTGGCFGYRLERCRGACIGKETALFYNIRLLEALNNVRIKPWPFTGPIMIQEKNDISEKYDYFLVDKWCYMGSANSQGFTQEEFLDTPLQFDLDVYKILRRYLMNPHNLGNVKNLENGMLETMTRPQLGVLV